MNEKKFKCSRGNHLILVRNALIALNYVSHLDICGSSIHGSFNPFTICITGDKSMIGKENRKPCTGFCQQTLQQSASRIPPSHHTVPDVALSEATSCGGSLWHHKQNQTWHCYHSYRNTYAKRLCVVKLGSVYMQNLHYVQFSETLINLPVKVRAIVTVRGTCPKALVDTMSTFCTVCFSPPLTEGHDQNSALKSIYM